MSATAGLPTSSFDRRLLSRLPDGAWLVVAGGAAALTSVTMFVGRRYTSRVRITPDLSVPSVRVLMVLAGTVALSGLVGLRLPRLGLAGLALAAMGASASWLLLDTHRLSGPVILNLGSRHGIHLTDPFAAVPALFGAIILAGLVRSAVRSAR